MTLSLAQRATKSALFIAELATLAWLFATEDLSQVGLSVLIMVGAIAVGVLIFLAWPIGCVIVLAVAAAMSRVDFKVVSLHVRPEHLATGIAILAIAFQFLRGKLSLKLHLRSFDYWLIAFVGMNFFSSAVTSPQPSMTLRWACLSALAVIPYFLMRYFVNDHDSVWLTVHALLWIGVIEAVYGTIASISNHVWGTTWGIEVGQYGSVPGTYGTQFEANLFGAYTASTAIMCLAFFSISKQGKRSWYAWGLVFGLVAAVFSLARSAILAVPIPVFVLIWLSAKKGHLQIRRLIPVAIALGLLFAALSPFMIDYIEERFSSLDLSDISTDDTTVGRLIQLEAAAEHVWANPILGTGTASFQLLYSRSEYLGIDIPDDEGGGWISNTTLRVLHDTGVVGLCFFLMFLATLARSTYKAAQIANHPTRVSIIALSMGLLLYAITFQATEATMLTFTWIHFGVLAAAVCVTLERREHLESTAQ